MTYFRLPLIILAVLVLAAPFQASAATGRITNLQIVTTPANANLTISKLRLIPAPTCNLHVSRSKIRSGDTTRFTWTSKDAQYLVANVKGRTYPLKGSENVAIGFPGTYRFDYVFVGKAGVTTCSKEVKVLPKKD